MNTNKSKLEVLFGEEVGSNDQSHILLDVEIGKNKAQAQIDMLKNLTQHQCDVQNGLVLVFPTTFNHSVSLAEMLEESFKGKYDTPMCKDLTKWAEQGLLTHRVIQAGDKVILVLKPSEMMEQQILGPVSMILSMGGQDIIENETNTVNVQVRSLNTFNDVEDDMAKGTTFIASICRSLKAEIDFTLDKNLLDKVLEIVSTTAPDLLATPLASLKIFPGCRFQCEIRVC
jgi:hypothetical protein